MKNAILLILLGSFLSACFTTKQFTMPYSSSDSHFKDWYTEFLTPEETVVNTWYHYMTSVTKDGKYVVRQFFPEKKQITSLTTYKNAGSMVKDGLSKTWLDSGSRTSAGHYKNDKQEGEWHYYHNGNSLSSIGNYIDGEKSGVWKSYDSDERLTKETTYVNGLKEGKFIMYDSLSNIINTGLYKADTIFEQTMKIERKPSGSKDDPYTVVEEMPYMKKCKGIADKDERMKHSQEVMLQSIYKNIRYPEDARRMEVEGTAIVRFYIDKDGTVKDINVLKGLCQSIANECKKVVMMLPEWEPGKIDGEPVKVYFNLPVRFRLE